MHHANLLVGSRKWALTHIPESERVECADVSIREFPRMSIADVRALIYDAHLMPVEASVRTFILIIDSILHEAQNALLKLFEEPPATTRFYLITPSEDMLLPTLRSRLSVLVVEEQGKTTKVFDAFLQSGYAERLSLIAERLKAEDGAWVKEIVQGLEHYAHTSRNEAVLKDTLMLLSYVHSVGSSKKMLLEHIALSL